ncbi:MAG: hypothetical protein ACI4IK_00415 [Eubacterium sp.]
MQLLVDSHVLRCAWGASSEYWFSRMDYSIYNACDLPSDDAAKLFEAGFIPFVRLSNEEVIRAYVESLPNKKITAAFEKLEGVEYVETFWKYFKAYSEVAQGFDAFENKYVIDKLTEWCRDNAVDFKLEIQ